MEPGKQEKGRQRSRVLQKPREEKVYMGKRLIELNKCREDKNCEKAPEHAREDFTDWQIDWNFPKPQRFLFFGFFFGKDLVSSVNVLLYFFFLLLLKRLMHHLIHLYTGCSLNSDSSI